MNSDIINIDNFQSPAEVGGTSSSTQQNADNFIQFYNSTPLNDYTSYQQQQQPPLNDFYLQQSSGHKTMDIFTDVKPLHPPEGRPILNTSLLKFAAQNQQQQQLQQNKARTPLTTVPNTNNIMVKPDGNVKKSNDITAEDDFFVFKLKQPQILNEGKCYFLFFSVSSLQRA